MGKLRIVSYSGQAFRDRSEAGRLLASQLKQKYNQKVIVLGIPRGGVIVAKQIADILQAELDVAIARKVGAPNNPEFAIGAVSETGEFFPNEAIASQLDSLAEYIQQEKKHQLCEIKKRIKLFRSVKPKLDLKERVIIVTDDGIATGATMQAVIWAVRKENPAKVIVALPVGPQDSIERISQDVDEIVALRVPPFFGAVGQFYTNFDQTQDEEVLEILKNG